MFTGARAFNQDLSAWNVSGIRTTTVADANGVAGSYMGKLHVTPRRLLPPPSHLTPPRVDQMTGTPPWAQMNATQIVLNGKSVKPWNKWFDLFDNTNISDCNKLAIE